MDYPLRLTFKILAIAPQIRVHDANGRLVFFVRQKAFKLREAVTIYGDEARSRTLATAEADRIIDFSAAYTFRDSAGRTIGALRRQGVRSLWKAHYDIMGPDGERVFRVVEENAFVKFLDGVFGGIPVLNMFAGYVFHPSYSVTAGDGPAVFRMRKRPSLLETSFEIEELVDQTETTEALIVISLLMMVLLERTRG